MCWCVSSSCCSACFFFNDTATTEIYTLSLHDALPISTSSFSASSIPATSSKVTFVSLSWSRSEEHTSELQSLRHLVCRLLLEKKKKNPDNIKRKLPPLPNNDKPVPHTLSHNNPHTKTN